MTASPSTQLPRGRAHRAVLLPVVETEPRRRGPDRAADRRVTFRGLVVAAAFLVAAAVSLLLPPAVRLGWWLPIHLALAGAAGTAIASMLPFFVAALAVARPVPAWLHGGAIALVATGAGLAGLGRAVDAGTSNPIAATGAVLFVAGAGAVAASAFLPLRSAAGQRRPVTEVAYLAGLVSVAVGVALGGLFLAGEPGILAGWTRLRAAHAWLNVFGFLTLVIAATLVHFGPTVAGARIRRRVSGHVAVTSLGVAVAAGATGYALAIDDLVRVGALALIVGAAALAFHGARVEAGKAGWTTDTDWHRVTSWSLLAAPVWLLVTALIVGSRVFRAGSSGEGWSLEAIVAPLVAGFAIQVLLGSLSHLVPAIGPGAAEHHAAARRMLGRLGPLRVIAWNVGTAVATIGLGTGIPALGLAGGAIVVSTLAATLGLLVAAWRR